MLSGSKIGKFVTIIAMLAVLSGNALGQTEWTKYEDPYDNDNITDPVLNPGLGDWEAHRVYYARVIPDGGIYKMYYTGQTDNYTSRFGYATSSDGISWNKYVDENGDHVPLLYPGGTWDSHNIYVPAVILDNGKYKMWYQGEDGTVNRIGYAISEDGIHWEKYPNYVIPALNEPGYASPGNVIIEEGQYIMYYSFQSPVPATTWRATSTNGIDWVNCQKVLPVGEPNAWDATEVYNPYVLKDGEMYHMWYFGHKTGIGGIGYATSVNGIDWQKSPANPVLSRGNPGDPDETNVDSPSVLREGSKLKMWYHGAHYVESSYRLQVQYATDEAPEANDDTILVPQGTQANIYVGEPDPAYQTDILDNDDDSDDTQLCIIMVTLPTGGILADDTGPLQTDDPHGRVLLNFYTGTLTYTPTDTSRTSDSFDYVVSDYKGGTDLATVYLVFDNGGPIVIYVPGDYGTIQEAIDASSDGDTVLVADGTYTGLGNINLDFGGRAITVKSENGAENCIIDCQNQDDTRGFYFHSGEGADSVVEGFTIRNGRILNPDYSGAGIRCLNSSPTIRGNMILDNSAAYGAGIMCNDSSPVIVDNIIMGNSASNDGGGVMLSYSSPLMANNVIANNSGYWGGGVVCQQSSSPTIFNNTIVGNSTGKGGSGIDCQNGAGPVITNCIIVNNTGGGQIAAITGSSATVTYSDVQGGWIGAGNIDADPLFVDAANGDYRLSSSSPCLGTGTNTGAPETDIEGNPRPNPAGSEADMGAYENPLDVSIDLSINLDQPSSDIAVIRGGTIDIVWTGIGPVDSSVSLWLDDDNVWENGGRTEIVSGQPLSGAYGLDTSSVQEGICYIVGMVDSEIGSDYGYALGKVTVFEPVEWDKHPENPIFHGGSHATVYFDGTEYKMWYTPLGTPYRVRLATSEDGVNWQDYSTTPVLDVGGGGQWDDNGVICATVLFIDGVYKMWYRGHDGSNYRIGLATSSDGKVWEKHPDNPVLKLDPQSWDSQHVLAPIVIHEGNNYKMWYAGNNGSRCKIGLATSENGYEWERYPGNPVLDVGAAGQWDSYEVVCSSVIFDDTNYKMWYAGSNDGALVQIGYAISNDGIFWSRYPDNPVLEIGSVAEWDHSTVTVPYVLFHDNRYEMWYTGYGNIGYANTDGIFPPVNHSPQIAITSPSAGDTVCDRVQIRAEVSDADNDELTVYFLVDDVIVHTLEGIINTATPQDVVYNWPTFPYYADGAHTIKVIADDGLVSTPSDPVSVTVKNVVDVTGQIIAFVPGGADFPIGNALLELIMDGQTKYSIMTDGNGEYQLLGVTPNEPGEWYDRQVTKDGDVLEIKGGDKKVHYDPGVDVPDEVIEIKNYSVVASCPVDIYVEDNSGNYTGMYGGVNQQYIPHSWYSGNTAEPETVVVLNPGSIYTVGVVGTGEGTFSLHVSGYITVNLVDTLITINLQDIPITAGEEVSFTHDFTEIESEVNSLVAGGSSIEEAIAQSTGKPVIIEIDGPVEAIQEGASAAISAGFVNPDILDTHTATINWSDGSPNEPGAVTESPAEGTVTGSHVYSDDGIYMVTVTVTDDDGASTMDTLAVTVDNVAPTVDAGLGGTINESETFNGSGSFTDPGADTWTATVNYGDGSEVLPLALNPDKTFELSHAYADDGNYTVTVEITDDEGGRGSDTVVVTVDNVTPEVTVNLSGDAIDEGDTLNGTGFFTDPGADAWTATVNYGDGSDPETLAISSDKTFSLEHAYLDNGNFTVSVIVDDETGSGMGASNIVVNNVSPVLELITAPLEPVTVETPITASADFTDSGTLDTHTAEWNWGDGTTASGTVTESDGSGTVADSHTYTIPGVYTVSLTVTDKDGDSDTTTFQYIVVYDPEGGFVTGGGWIISPAGAYIPDPTLEGKATFGFVSKYKKGATVPTGETEFNFRVADVNFHSTEYQWLVIAGSKAKYKGDGTINGEGEYGFMLTAIDGDLGDGGDPDKFRIKIWEKAKEETVYDNKFDADEEDLYDAQVIGGGSIVIHEDKDKDPKAAPRVLPNDTCLLLAYPNPFNPDVWIPYRLGSDCKVVISIHDVSGRLVRTMNLGHRIAGFYVDKSKAAYWDGRNEAGEHVASGLYFYTIQAGQYAATRKMVVNK